MTLGVDTWPDATGWPDRPAIHRPVEEGAPAWWGEGENTTAFLAAQGIRL